MTTRPSKASVESLSPKDRCWFAIRQIRDQLMTNFHTSDDYESNKDELSQSQIGLCAASLLCAEVANGGFHQYFANSSGVTFKDAIMGFSMLGAKRTAALVREAGQHFPNGHCPEDQDDRRADLEDIEPEQFRPLEKRFFSLMAGEESFDDLAVAYVEKKLGSIFQLARGDMETKMKDMVLDWTRDDSEDTSLDSYIEELCQCVKRIASMPQMDLNTAEAAREAHQLIGSHLLQIDQQRRIARSLLQLAGRRQSDQADELTQTDSSSEDRRYKYQ